MRSAIELQKSPFPPRPELPLPHAAEATAPLPIAPEECWRAVETKEAAWDGLFVYAVRSTGIYCRPSCPSRRPHRRQVVFYPGVEAAEQAGFRACRRCHPRLFAEAAVRRKLAAELAVAADIQRRLVPDGPPRLPGWQVAGLSRPHGEVGGDYFDFVPRSDPARRLLALGDVAGKGPGAALLAASLHAAVRAQARVCGGLAEVLAEVNRYLCESTPANKFATLFAAEVEADSGRVRFANAGHPPPLVARRDGRVESLAPGGLPLGIRPEARYAEQALDLAPGDTLVIYSDGASERLAESGEEFGLARLSEVVAAGRGLPAATLLDRIGFALRRFAGAAPPDDDLTLVVARREQP
jgi:sigma-B regulation protein RsbU (phosphoserine phosphatase)